MQIESPGGPGRRSGACRKEATIKHNATASGATATRRVAVPDGGPSLNREVVWPVNSAGSSLTFRGAGISLSPSKVEERRQSSGSKRVGGPAFYWESGDRLSFRPADRSESVSRLEGSLERGRSLDRCCICMLQIP